MSEALPASIVAHLEALGRALVQVAHAHRDETLATLEGAPLATIRTAMPGLVGAVLEAGTTSLQPGGLGRTQVCPGCGARCRVQSWRERTLTTVCGAITWERPWYHCDRCGRGWSPTDRTWGLASRERVSAGVADWRIDLGASTSFADAARELGKLTGLAMSAETIRRYTERRGATLEAADPTVIQRVEATREAAEVVDRAPGELVVEADGVMVRYQEGWHEVKLGVVGGQEGGDLRAVSYVAAREPIAYIEQELHTNGTIPPRQRRVVTRACGFAADKGRHLVARCIGKLKHFRRVISRFDKDATHFLAFIHRASTCIWLKSSRQQNRALPTWRLRQNRVGVFPNRTAVRIDADVPDPIPLQRLRRRHGLFP